MHTRTRQRQQPGTVRRTVLIGGIFKNRRHLRERRSVRTIQAVPVPVHALATAGANDNQWFEQSAPEEACNANGTQFLTEMRDRHPEWYEAMYGDMEP